MEELLEKLIKRYPNYYELGAAVNWVYAQLKEREKVNHSGFDPIDERIELRKLICQLDDKNFNHKSFQLK